MNAREEFERIKGNIKDLRKAMIELGQHPMMNESDLKDLETLINIIDAMDKSIKKHNLNSQYGKKVQMANLYGQRKEIYKNVDVYIDKEKSKMEDYLEENERFKSDIVYMNVDVEIKENILKITPSDTKGDFLSIYNINNLDRIRIRPNELKIKSKYFTREQIKDVINNSVC